MEFKGDGDKIEQTAEELVRRGIPKRAAAFASSMGYLRQLKKKK
ncbi:hypothetical protein [Ornithinibacillus xuwenensis]|jgi:hypothetical protein|uniref:Uncharacterized protein n=1 Tax=Ornithinibacillus xuwenensis TaxID=3144668 RepID=A0ABU9XF08_9BACI